MVQASRQMNPQQRAIQQEQCQAMIRKIKQQMHHQQTQIQAQQLLNQRTNVPPPPVMPKSQQQQLPPSMSTSSADVAADLSNLTLASSQANNNSQVPQSRLNQWIKDNAPEGERQGFKPSMSAPNLQAKDDAALAFADSTWGPSMSGVSGANWPASGTSTTGANSVADIKTSMAAAGGDYSAVSSAAGVTSAEAAAALDIVEFVPGKPWQGLPLNSVEDDPFITPASVSRSFSFNALRDDQLLASNKGGSNTSPTASDWSGSGARQQWSVGDDWNQKSAAAAGARPGTSMSGRAAAAYNRSMSMPAGPSECIRLSNSQQPPC